MMETDPNKYIEKLMKEYKELDEKKERLDNLMAAINYDELQNEDELFCDPSVLYDQVGAMNRYLKALETRIGQFYICQGVDE